MSGASPHAGRFLNVDLDLESAQDLSALAAVLRPHLVLLLDSEPIAGGYLLRAELEESPGLGDTFAGFLQILENLPADARRHWDGCTRRELNIGWEADPGHIGAAFQLDPPLLLRAAQLGISLGVTLYQSHPKEELQP